MKGAPSDKGLPEFMVKYKITIGYNGISSCFLEDSVQKNSAGAHIYRQKFFCFKGLCQEVAGFQSEKPVFYHSVPPEWIAIE